MTLAVCPGTFDPVTNGHLDIIRRGAALFDEIIVAVAAENYKNNLFSLEERTKLIEAEVADLKGVRVQAFNGLLVEFVRSCGAKVIIRGLRAVSDFEYEMQLAMMNKRLAEEVETLFLMTANDYSFLSSSIIKQIASLGGSISGMVPPGVDQALKERYGELLAKRSNLRGINPKTGETGGGGHGPVGWF